MTYRLALSIRQPWLYCVTDLDKRIENRSWKPPSHIIGKRIYLHASKKMDSLLGRRVASNLAGFKLSTRSDEMPLGALVATAIISGWISKGDNKWFFGPYGWILTDVQKITEPIICRGALGLWHLPENLEATP